MRIGIRKVTASNRTYSCLSGPNNNAVASAAAASIFSASSFAANCNNLRRFINRTSMSEELHNKVQVRENSLKTDASEFLASLPANCRLPPITELSERVTRVMGMNPGPMTLGGTNTYLVGKGSKKALIDTGDGLDSFIDIIKQHITEKGITITDIILTHWHHDHVGGLRSVLELFPEARVIKRPSKVMPNDRLVRDAWGFSEGTAKKKNDPVTKVRVVADTLITLPEDLTDRCVVELKPPSGLLKTPAAHTSGPDELVECNTGHYHPHDSPTSMSVMKLQIDPDTSLLFIPTPGHTDDHVSLLLKEEHAVFSGDCVLGTGSSVFVCYSDFMSSLGHLERIAPSVIYPGHGPMVSDGVGRIREFITHRLVREKQVLDFLVAQGPKKPVTVMEIVKVIYKEVPEKMHMAAAGNVIHILKRMLDDKRVVLVDCTVLENPTPEAVAEQDAYHDFLAEEEYHEVPDNGAAFEGEGSAVDWKKMTTYVTLLQWHVKS